MKAKPRIKDVLHRHCAPHRLEHVSAIRAGGRWKDLPDRFGKIGTVKRRYCDGMGRGVLSDILAVLAEEADLEWVCVDAPIVRAHQQAAGARRQKGARMPRAWAAPAAT